MAKEQERQNVLLPIKFKYRLAYLPTPRCRKYRYKDEFGETNVCVRELTRNEIPVACVVTDGIKPETLSKVNATPNIYDVRFFDGRFFRRVKNREFVCGGKGYATAKDLQDHIESMMYGYHCGRNFEEQAKEAQSCADAFLFVEKEVWRECGEPRYEVCTFGLGHNHGGTSAFVQFGYNGNIPYCNYFNANQKTEAIAYADKIASERGDTKSVGRCFDFADIDILMPDVFTCDPKKEHGNGDPFMNSLEEMIRSTDSANEAAILTMATCAKKTVI